MPREDRSAQYCTQAYQLKIIVDLLGYLYGKYTLLLVTLVRLVVLELIPKYVDIY